MNTNTGFTLVELLITVAIAAIVLTLGVPSFQETIRTNRLATATNELIGSFSLARSEAIRRRAPITICASSDQATCSDAAWSEGWIVRLGDGEVLRVFGPMKPGLTTTATRASVTYTASGFLTSAGTKLELCAGSGTTGRGIGVSPAGRPSVIRPNPAC